jgi:hypothetical protein
MSQSDYITFKKTALILRNNSTTATNDLPSVLTPELYTAFTTYNLETTVSNTKNAYNRLLPSGRKNFLDIEKTFQIVRHLFCVRIQIHDPIE